MVLQLQKRKMALAGLVMTAYLIFHMLTNLSFFIEHYFTAFYAFYNIPLLRWSLLFVVITALTVHVIVAIRIRRINAQARSVDYAQHDSFKIPAKLVTLSIIFILLFIVVHIVQTVTMDSEQLYSELIQLFNSAAMLVFYLAGLLVLTLHLQHSLANVLQTLGKTSRTCHGLVWLAVISLTGGFAAVPLYIYFGLP